MYIRAIPFKKLGVVMSASQEIPERGSLNIFLIPLGVVQIFLIPEGYTPKTIEIPEGVVQKVERGHPHPLHLLQDLGHFAPAGWGGGAHGPSRLHGRPVLITNTLHFHLYYSVLGQV